MNDSRQVTPKEAGSGPRCPGPSRPRRAWCASLVGVLACGEPPAPVAKPPSIEPPASASAVVVEDLPPEAPAAPESLVLVVRARNPEDTWKVVRALHPGAVDLAKELSARSDDASRFVSLAEPWDVGVVLDPQWERAGSARFLTAVSIPLGDDVDGFLSLVEEKGDSVRKLGPGRYRIVSGESLRCEVWSRGGTGRMVCSDGAPALGELGGWMALTLAAEPKPTADLTLRVRMAPLRAPFVAEGSRELASFVGEVSEALARTKIDGSDLLASLGHGDAELKRTLDDLDELTASVRIQPQSPELTLSGALRWRSKEALFTQVAAGRLVAAEPPAEFWRLPRDAELAFFGRGLDEKLLLGPRALARRAAELAIDGAAQRQFADFFTPKDKAAYLSAFDGMPIPTGPWAFAVGAIPDTANGAPTIANGPKAVVAEAERRIASAIGWSVFSGEGDAAVLTSSVKRALEAADAHVKLMIKDLERNAGGKRKSFGGRVNFYQERKEALQRTAPKWKFSKDPAGYPKGTGLFEITFGFDNGDVRDVVTLDDLDSENQATAKRTFALGKVPVKLAVLPGEAGRVVWGVSVDADTLRTKLLSSTSTGAKSDTLAARTDLGPLTTKLASGGFMHIGPTLSRLMTIDPRDRDFEALRDVLAATPSKVAGRAIFTLSGVESEAPSMNFTVSLDRSVVVDVLSLLRPD